MFNLYNGIIYHIRENVHGANFHGFSLDCKYFPANHGFVDQQYKSTETLQQKFYRKQLFSTQNAKVFPHRRFLVYGMCGSTM